MLCGITLIAGLALSGIFAMTEETIEEQKAMAAAESYKEVLADAESFQTNDAMDSAIAALEGGTYGTDFGKVTINEAFEGVDGSGNVVGYAISVTSGDGFDGNITMAVGITADGTVTGISFTELNETAGMGMRVDEDAFKGQFVGRNVSAFVLNKAGGSTSDEEIDSVSGASISSSAVVNAVNAALDFFASNAN
ncbi:MAG: RnfABCDGE type electron transport complex subunit G [Lachnospiraceae bacterium]|nr:RnfABCDGE type electron transport complex subunit G [Lachnospiraceae bacterium]